MNSPASSPGADRQGIQVIARAAALLRALMGQPGGMSFGELAKSVGLPRSTVQRIVDALHREGLVIAASTANGVRLGPALLSLAAATRFHIADVARETLQALARECGETVDLSVVDQEQMVFVDQVPGTHRLTAVSAVGVSFPLHSSANGKAVLAAMADEDLASLRKRLKLVALTSRTITDWAALEAEVAAVRRKGVAYDDEENSPGISAVAMAVSAPGGEFAAISIPVPTFRFQLSRVKLEKALRRHGAELQRKLSGA